MYGDSPKWFTCVISILHILISTDSAIYSTATPLLLVVIRSTDWKRSTRFPWTHHVKQLILVVELY